MTDLEYASHLSSVAARLRNLTGDHIKLATYADELDAEALRIRDPNAEPVAKIVPLSGQASAEVPGYVLKDDPNAPKGVPVVPEETKADAVNKGDLRPGINDLNLAAEQGARNRGDLPPVADETVEPIDETVAHEADEQRLIDERNQDAV